MQSLTNIIGIILIVFGVIILGYQGYTYRSEEKVAQIGDLKVTAVQDKHVYVSPIVGGVMVIAGIVLVISTRIGKR